MSKPWKPGPFPVSKYVKFQIVTAEGKPLPRKSGGRPHTNRIKVEERAARYTAATGQATRVEIL